MTESEFYTILLLLLIGFACFVVGVSKAWKQIKRK